MIAQDNINRAHFSMYAAMDVECGGLEYVKATTDRIVSPDEAKAIAAQFPGSIGLRAHRFIGRPGATATGEVVFHAELCPNKPRQGVNAGGVKCYRSFRKHAERLGHEVDYDPGHFQSSPDVVSSEEDFENRLWTLRECGAPKAKLWNPQEIPAKDSGQDSARRLILLSTR
jgi:hypothetical protein